MSSNQSIKRGSFQIPVAEEIFGRCKVLNVLQLFMLNQDFGRFLLYRCSSLLTTFITPFGRFQCLRLPDQITEGTSLGSPTNLDQFRTISGMFSYLAMFVPEFAHKVVPLRNLFRENKDRT